MGAFLFKTTFYLGVSFVLLWYLSPKIDQMGNYAFWQHQYASILQMIEQSQTHKRYPENNSNSYTTKQIQNLSLNDAQKVILTTANSFIGVPYLYGGNTKNGIDCSAFTKTVYTKIGIELPRTAAWQYKVGRKINKSDLEPGDLVFFHTYKPGASHVGIYAGNGKMYNASSSKGVTLSNINSGYFNDRYIGARRVLE